MGDLKQHGAGGAFWEGWPQTFIVCLLCPRSSMYFLLFLFLPDAHRPPPRRQRKRRRQLPPRLQSCHRVKLPCLRSGICVPLSVTHTPSIPTSLQNREHQLFPIGPVHFSTGRGDGGGKVERGRGNEQRRGRNKGRKKLTMLLSSPVCLASVTC